MEYAMFQAQYHTSGKIRRPADTEEFRPPRFLPLVPAIRPIIIAPAPHCQFRMALQVGLCRGSAVMDTTLDHRRHAEECVAQAQSAESRKDKALWLTLAQSWVRLAQDMADVETSLALETNDAADSAAVILAGEC
jgi:hypothetical protein